jgi:hypothetical protein
VLHVVLTLDYEIFGNGAGDVRRDVIEPTSRILDICDKHGAKLTIMFEVGEYWAFQQYDSRLQKDLGYSPCRQMKGQAVDAIKRGHDVQLHLHPQWIGAQYGKNRWRLDNSCWRLADLPAGLGSTDQANSITGVLYRGKHSLEKMLRPVKGDYECVSFRAGGFYAQPSKNAIAAMKKAGIRSDSSVVKGYKSSPPFEVDYSQVEVDKDCWWTTSTELTMVGQPGENVLEFPVSSKLQPYWKNFKITKVRAALRRKAIEDTSRREQGIDTKISSVPKLGTALRKLFSKHASAFDFGKLSSKDMLNRIRKYNGVSEQTVVLIGHSKDFCNDHNLDVFLKELKQNNQVRFSTLFGSVHSKINES